MGISVVLTNFVKHIAEPLLGLGPPRLVDKSLLTWINSEHMLHTSNDLQTRLASSLNATGSKHSINT